MHTHAYTHSYKVTKTTFSKELSVPFLISFWTKTALGQRTDDKDTDQCPVW